MTSKTEKLLVHPSPVRALLLRAIRLLRVGGYVWRVRVGAVERPHYAHCVYNSAILAKRLGYDRISVIEFGVAGGRGLVALEAHAARVSKIVGIEIEVYGFDTGQGLPPPDDYRDLPYHWKAGFFEMDHEKLRAKLERATLVLGDVRETATKFWSEHDPAPIAAVMHDFDLYSSTAVALEMFDVDERHRLPRVYCYFDDITGTDVSLYNDFTGERLAINEYNDTHETKKLSIAYHLTPRRVVAPWCESIFIFHDFEHSRYNDFVSDEDQQRPLA